MIQFLDLFISTCLRLGLLNEYDLYGDLKGSSVFGNKKWRVELIFRVADTIQRLEDRVKNMFSSR